MKTSLAPAPLNWGKERLFEFYKDALENKFFDDYYIGEISCQERGAKSKSLLLDLAHLIKDHGKNLYLSSYAIVTKMSQIEDIKDLLHLADGLEVNNLAFLELDFDGILIVGPFLNIYNWQSANYLSRLGFKRMVLPPVDLTLESITDIAKNAVLETEVIFEGRRSLAVSRRCYYLRALNLSDGQCNMNCFDRPDGLTLNNLFMVDGKEIFSQKIHSRNEQRSLLESSGVAVLRFGYGNFK